ncbi:MAG: cation:dicarboxylase symporter family transporter [bacterium]|nr:cation:dicarboxylase symporter family transporter [bacterium]
MNITAFASIFKKNTGLALLVSFMFGLLLALADISLFNSVADLFIELFSRFLKFLSVPIIFLSITAAICNTEILKDRTHVFSRTVIYVLLTTVIATLVAMSLYFLLSPVNLDAAFGENIGLNTADMKKYLIEFMPDNLFKPFLQGNVFAVVLMALSIGFLFHGLELRHRQTVQQTVDAFFHLFMGFAKLIIFLLPLVLWAFVLVFANDVKSGRIDDKMYLYVATILSANFIQACVILPLFLKIKGIPIHKTLRGMFPALMTAFFSKSSSATMPLTLTCLQENLKVRRDVVSFTIPLCTTINMNACAAFIYVTVLFVAQSSGVVFTGFDYVIWFFLAILGAIGNAGVPMGCYFMASAFIVSLGAPTYLMSVILPFYLILDMFETAINVWSDACVTLAVASDVEKRKLD